MDFEKTDGAAAAIILGDHGNFLWYLRGQYCMEKTSKSLFNSSEVDIHVDFICYVTVNLIGTVMELMALAILF